jgi:hypothetical protein
MHFGGWLVVMLVFAAVGFLGNSTPALWIRWAVWVGGPVYFILIFLAPFGIGPLAKRLTKAALDDERDSWRN